MRAVFSGLIVGACLALASAGSPVMAQGVRTIVGSQSVALKNGESLEVSTIYYVTNCKSMLKGTPEVEILDGPSGVEATIKEAMVLPRIQSCGNKVPGGVLVLSARNIEDPSYSNLVLRISYKTKDGERKFSQVFNVSLIP
jgi:hypothetical protein